MFGTLTSSAQLSPAGRAATVQEHRRDPGPSIRTQRRTTVNASVTHPGRPAHLAGEVPGAERLLGRTRDDLADALTWLAWYAPGTYTAVMDYMDHCDGEPRPAGQPRGM